MLVERSTHDRASGRRRPLRVRRRRALRERDVHARPRRARCPRRAERRGKVDAPAHRRGRDRAGRGQRGHQEGHDGRILPPVARDRGQRGDVLSALLSGYGDVLALREKLAEAQRDGRRRRQGSARAPRARDRRVPHRAEATRSSTRSPRSRTGSASATRTSRAPSRRSRAASAAAFASASCSRRSRSSSSSTSRRTTSTSTRSRGSRRTSRRTAARCSSCRTIARSSTTRAIATFELGRKGLRAYPLKYSDYAVAREEDLARERALLERQQDFIDKTEDFIRKNIAGQKTKQAQSRRKMLEKLDRVERPEDVWKVAEKMSVRFAPGGALGRHRARLQGPRRLARRAHAVRERRAPRSVAASASASSVRTARARPRSSTSSRAAAHPEDRGAVRARGTNLQEGYFDQHLGEVNPANTAVEEVRIVRGDFTVEKAREYLARFRFWGDAPLRVVSGYSGGERSRLALAKLLLEPRNLLFLDEPTNHLDIPAAEILEEALASLRGHGALRLARPALPRERRDAHRERARRPRGRLQRRLPRFRAGYQTQEARRNPCAEAARAQPEPPPAGKTSYEAAEGQGARRREEEAPHRRARELDRRRRDGDRPACARS